MKLPMVAASELDNITKVCVCVCPFEHVQVQHARTWGPVVMCRPGLFLFFNPWSDLFASGHKAILLLLSATEGGIASTEPSQSEKLLHLSRVPRSFAAQDGTTRGYVHALRSPGTTHMV